MTYDSIMKTFTKTIDKLNALVDVNVKKRNNINIKIEKLSIEDNALNIEATKAQDTVKKLQGLIGV